MLLKDPTSWLQAAMNNWKHPVSFEWTLLAAQYDMNAHLNTRKGSKAQLFQKPWPAPNVVQKGTARSDAKDILKLSKDGDLQWHNKPMPM